MKPTVRYEDRWWRVRLTPNGPTVASYGTWGRAMHYVELIHQARKKKP